MKAKKIKSSEPVTRAVLKEELAKFSTKEELLATKKELKAEIALVRLDMKDMEERLDDKNRKYKDEILTKIDSFAGKTAVLEEENAVGANQIRELDVKVDDHEKRITSLESATQ